MLYTEATNRSDRYAVCGRIIADTAKGVGIDSKTMALIRWEDTMYRLATADDLSETNPDFFSDPTILVNYLDLNPDNSRLVASARNLLNASNDSHSAKSIPEHYKARGREAVESLNLLRFQSTGDVASPAQEHAWQQLYSVAKTGTHLDSFMDAESDKSRLSQFTVAQLSMGALASFVRDSRQIEPSTWRELCSAAHKAKLDNHLARKLARAVNPCGVRLRA